MKLPLNPHLGLHSSSVLLIQLPSHLNAKNQFYKKSKSQKEKLHLLPPLHHQPHLVLQPTQQLPLPPHLHCQKSELQLWPLLVRLSKVVLRRRRWICTVFIIAFPLLCTSTSAVSIPPKVSSKSSFNRQTFSDNLICYRDPITKLSDCTLPNAKSIKCLVTKSHLDFNPLVNKFKILLSQLCWRSEEYCP